MTKRPLGWSGLKYWGKSSKKGCNCNSKIKKQEVAPMTTVTLPREGELNLAYETKVILISLAEIAKKADSVKEVYEAIAKMANAEGVILEPFDQEKEG
jgi:hypothetical protein